MRFGSGLSATHGGFACARDDALIRIAVAPVPFDAITAPSRSTLSTINLTDEEHAALWIRCNSPSWQPSTTT